MASIWHKNFKDWAFPQVSNDIETELLIIGGGIAGLSCAYELMQQNKKFVLVDAKKLGRGITAGTTAQISIAHDNLYQEIKKKHGLKKAEDYLDNQVIGLNRIKEIIINENIDCDYKEESSILGTNDVKKEHILNNLFSIIKNRTNAQFIELNNKFFQMYYGVEIPNQIIINPIKYINGLTSLLKRNNSGIYEESKVTKLIKTNNGYKVIINNKYCIFAKKIIMACHYPFMLQNLYFAKMYQSTSYAIAFKTKVKIPANYISLDTPYYYLRTYDKDTLIIGGSDHYTGANTNIDKCYFDLLQKIYEIDKNATILYKWFDEDCMPVNSLPYIGSYSRKHKDIILISGFQKWGFTNSSYAALKISQDLNSNYSPNKLTICKSILDYLRLISHSVNGLVISKLLIKKADLSSIDIDSGKALRYKNKNLLVYREAENKYFFLKNKCTHMGCSLVWDNINKVWISRCHGTVYNKYGKVMYGPGIENLKKINL